MKVSLITTLYNYRHYIEDAIKSFLAQDLDDSEMIIVDDASSDNPYKIISKYIGNRVIYIRIDKNSGYSHAKNVGIKSSKSDIIAMLDADDMLTPKSLSIRYKRICEGYDFVHGAVLDLSGKEKRESRMKKKWLKTGHPKYIHAQGVMLRKQIHREIGLYDEDLRCSSDREMFYRIFYRGYKIGWTKEPVAIYRKHKNQMHKSKFKLKINEELHREIKKKIEVRKYDLSDLEMLT